MKTTRYTVEKLPTAKPKLVYGTPRDYEIATVTDAVKTLWNPRIKTAEELIEMGFQSFSFSVRHKEGKKRGQIVRIHTYYFKNEKDFDRFLVIIEQHSGGTYNYLPHNVNTNNRKKDS